MTQESDFQRLVGDLSPPEILRRRLAAHMRQARSCMSQYPRAWDARTPALIFAQDAIVFPPPPRNQGLGPARLLGSRRDSKRGTAGWVSTQQNALRFHSIIVWRQGFMVEGHRGRRRGQATTHPMA